MESALIYPAAGYGYGYYAYREDPSASGGGPSDGSPVKPHRILHALCYPLAAALLVAFVAPYRALRRRPRGHGLAASMPLKTYADYPFGVLVNDQLDRFSAPLERRYTAQEVRDALAGAGLEDTVVLSNHGWVADGRQRATTSPPDVGRPPA